MQHNANFYQVNLVKKFQQENCYRSYLRLKIDFQNLIYKTAHKFKNKFANTPFEFQDICLYLEVFFFELTKAYKLDSPKTFGSYISDFLNFKMTTLLKTFITKNHTIMNYASFEDMTSINFEENTESVFVDYKEQLLFISNAKFLTKTEVKIFELVRQNKNIDEISFSLKKSKKSIYSSMYRARKKLVTHLSN